MKPLLMLSLAFGVLMLARPVPAEQNATQPKAPEEATQTPAKTDAVKATPLPAGDGHDLVSTTCSQCHMLTAVTAHHETEDRWKRYVDDMVVHGAKLTPAEAKTVIQYMTKNFGPPPAAASTPPQKTTTVSPDASGKDLVQEKCSVCHDTDRISKVYRDEQGWSDLVDGMVSRGAVLTSEEIQKIRAYLFSQYGIP